VVDFVLYITAKKCGLNTARFWPFGQEAMYTLMQQGNIIHGKSMPFGEIVCAVQLEPLPAAICYHFDKGSRLSQAGTIRRSSI
jgi:hypothetical protein